MSLNETKKRCDIQIKCKNLQHFMAICIEFLNKKDQPEEIPAAEPAALRESFLWAPLSNNEPTILATEAPISTLGPSGPNELPVPRVTQAAIAFKIGSTAAFILDDKILSVWTSRAPRNVFNKLTTNPPKAGTKITCCHTTSVGSSLNHKAPRCGIPFQQKSRISWTWLISVD